MAHRVFLFLVFFLFIQSAESFSIGLQVKANDTSTYLKLTPLEKHHPHFYLTFPSLNSSFEFLGAQVECSREMLGVPEQTRPVHSTFKMMKGCSLFLFTHFFGQSQVDLVIGIRDMLGFSQEIPIEFQAKGILPFYSYQLVVPQSIEEGRKFYHRFSQAHLKRQIAFSEIDPPKIMITTIPRSGTHILIDGLEKLLGQYVGGLQPRDPVNPALSKMEEYGVIKNGPMFHRLVENHKLNVYWSQAAHQIERYVILVRDPLYTIDSHFHFYATDSSYDGKLPSDVVYWNDAEYFQFMNISSKVWASKMTTFFDSKFTMQFVRHEDMMGDSSRTFCEIISFIERVPCQVTLWHERVLEHFQTHTHASFIASNSSTVPKRKNLYEIIPKAIIQMLYRDGKEWLEEFSYDQKYLSYFKGEKQEELKLFDYPLYEKNKKELEKFFKYSEEPYRNPIKPMRVRINEQAYNKEMTRSRVTIAKLYSKYLKK